MNEVELILKSAIPHKTKYGDGTGLHVFIGRHAHLLALLFSDSSTQHTSGSLDMAATSCIHEGGIILHDAVLHCALSLHMCKPPYRPLVSSAQPPSAVVSFHKYISFGNIPFGRSVMDLESIQQ